MCGIVGFIDNDGSTLKLVEKLSKLEYRGYDSAGIAYLKNNDYKIIKSVGKIVKLKEMIQVENTCVAIGHTRWATNGKVNEINCHPHCGERVIVIHNGVIDNFAELKEIYFKNKDFNSETDTELIPYLLELFLKDCDHLTAIERILKILSGSFSFLVVDKKDNNKIFFAKNKTPLLIGLGESKKIIASDIAAFDESIIEYIRLEDYSYGFIDEFNLSINSIVGEEIINKKPFIFSNNNVDKGEFEHFMIKEIFDQPNVIRKVIDYYETLELDDIKNIFLKNKKIIFLGAGTSHYAGLYSAKILEKILDKKSEAYLASEFAYYPPIIDKDYVFILFSQSGETADLVECVKLIKEYGNNVILFTNNINSTLAYMCDKTIDLNAGIEVSVASTKAYLSMVINTFIVCKKIKNEGYKKELNEVILGVEDILFSKDVIKKKALEYVGYNNIYYLGRGNDFFACLEGALKLKEISYINCVAYPSGELKHGTLSLVDNNTLVISLISNKKTFSLVESNINEARSRGAKSLTITNKKINDINTIYIKSIDEQLNPLLGVVWFQLFAYYVAYLKSYDIDKPRNLAKSVTVE